MNDSEEKLREAARTIRTDLKSRLNKADALTLSTQLDEILGQVQQGTQVGPSIRKLLTQRDETRTWLQVFLETGEAPSALRGYSSLPGDSRLRVDLLAPKADKFVCPEGDCEWYRPFVGARIPHCPKHNKLLVKAWKKV